jgi:hypothetical protein
MRLETSASGTSASAEIFCFDASGSASGTARRMSSMPKPGSMVSILAIAHVLIPGGVGIGQELAWLRKFDSGIAS